MSRIRSLPSTLVNQIAAGEVIERPASVVKELLENALDAGATEILIELEAAGQSKIRITDNGHGIHPDDLELAFAIHATSKIQTVEDLLRVQSHGFRGEALASVASVAQVHLTSKHRDHPQAFQFSPHLNKPPRPTAHPQGTSVEVLELFYNIPARKKFLKSERNERATIDLLIKQFALAHPTVRLTVNHNGKRAAQYDGDLPSRLHSIFGAAFAQSALKIEAEHLGMRLRGFVSAPSVSHSQSDKQFFYINQRIVRDKNLQYALKQAYQDLLHHGQHPMYALFLTIDPEEIDVNAHPSKLEVRLHNARVVQDWLYQTVKSALRQTIASQFESALPEIPQISPASTLSSPSRSFNPARNTSPKDLARQTEAYFRFAQSIPPVPLPDQSALPEPLLTTPPLGFAIGSLHDIFILAQNPTGLIVVDTHAAHERILYEKLKRHFENHSFEQQALLLPVTLPADEALLETVQIHAHVFMQLGIQLKLTAQEIEILAVPTLLQRLPPSVLVGQLLEELAQYDSSHRAREHLDKLLSSIACHKALRAHDPQTLDEMNHLLRELEQTEAGGSCNHGRPTWRQFSVDEVGLWFKRGQ